MVAGELPAAAKDFLLTRAGRHADRQVRTFHYWLADHRLELVALRRRHVDAFLRAPAGNPITSLTRNDYANRQTVTPKLGNLEGPREVAAQVCPGQITRLGYR